jgi:formylmethanofuran dehydrogenase subunit E
MESLPKEYTSYLSPILAVLGLVHDGKSAVSELQLKRRQMDESVSSKILKTLDAINANTSIWDGKKSFKILAYGKVFHC